MASVSGTATLDGTPLENVAVTFDPKEGGRAYTGRTNANGEFDFEVVVGNHSVAIATMSDAPSPDDDEGDPIPARYNRKTTLEEEVVAGDNTYTYELTTKK